MKICQARRVSSTFSLSGDSAIWQSAGPVEFSGKPLAGHSRRAQVRCLWNESSLFVSFEVESCRLHARVNAHDGDGLWLDDGVELLVDPLRHRTKAYLPDDFAYHINILNAVFDDRGTAEGLPDASWNGTAEHHVRILGDTRYTIDMAVSWAEIGVRPIADETILGVDFCVNGSHPDTWEYDYFDWCGLPLFHDPSGFGDLLLVGGSE